jgi:hypothetical protein
MSKNNIMTPTVIILLEGLKNPNSMSQNQEEEDEIAPLMTITLDFSQDYFDLC